MYVNKTQPDLGHRRFSTDTEDDTASLRHIEIPTGLDRPIGGPPVLAPVLLSVPEAARLLGIGRTTVYELIAGGQLEVVHIGRSIRVPTAAIDAFVDRLMRARSDS